MTRRLLLITHSYSPESTAPQRRWKKFLSGLYDAGWNVEVLTPPADPRYVDEAQKPEPHVTIRRDASREFATGQSGRPVGQSCRARSNLGAPGFDPRR